MKSDMKLTHDDGTWTAVTTLPTGEVIRGSGMTPSMAVRAFNDARAEADAAQLAYLTSAATLSGRPKYRIKPKRDFGKQGFLIDGNLVRSGFVVTDGTCNVMPGATWFRTIRQALHGIECLERANAGQGDFWTLVRS